MHTSLCMGAGAVYMCISPERILVLCIGNALAPEHFSVLVEVSSNESQRILLQSSIHVGLVLGCLAGSLGFSCILLPGNLHAECANGGSLYLEEGFVQNIFLF